MFSFNFHSLTVPSSSTSRHFPANTQKPHCIFKNWRGRGPVLDLLRPWDLGSLYLHVIALDIAFIEAMKATVAVPGSQYIFVITFIVGTVSTVSPKQFALIWMSSAFSLVTVCLKKSKTWIFYLNRLCSASGSVLHQRILHGFFFLVQPVRVLNHRLTSRGFLPCYQLICFMKVLSFV